MRSKITGLVVLLISSAWSSCSGQSTTTSTPSGSAAVPSSFDKVFEGTINNKLEIEMKLQRNGDSLSGTYQYRKYGLGIPIKGIIDDARRFVIKEYATEDGRQTGTFEGTFVSDSELNGTWSNLSGDKVMTFWLREKESVEGSASSTANTTASNLDSPLTVVKVQRAVDQALDWTRKGGNATVIGVQEIPQQNAARADIRFNQFQFNSNSYGMPVDKNKKTPPEPAISDPRFYEKMLQNRTGQIHVETYSGQGAATLAHYNDGKWVLTGVQFGLDGVKANIEIR